MIKYELKEAYGKLILYCSSRDEQPAVVKSFTNDEVLQAIGFTMNRACMSRYDYGVDNVVVTLTGNAKLTGCNLATVSFALPKAE